ncbi:hypothetical protein HDU93_000875 [Gonapodya sp. JEL0774]|nr:hypothetical protein HDU93_000875 [Gonapodya sp. JEL0774]
MSRNGLFNCKGGHLTLDCPISQDAWREASERLFIVDSANVATVEATFEEHCDVMLADIGSGTHSPSIVEECTIADLKLPTSSNLEVKFQEDVAMDELPIAVEVVVVSNEEDPFGLVKIIHAAVGAGQAAIIIEETVTTDKLWATSAILPAAEGMGVGEEVVALEQTTASSASMEQMQVKKAETAVKFSKADAHLLFQRIFAEEDTVLRESDVVSETLEATQELKSVAAAVPDIKLASSTERGNERQRGYSRLFQTAIKTTPMATRHSPSLHRTTPASAQSDGQSCFDDLSVVVSPTFRGRGFESGQARADPSLLEARGSAPREFRHPRQRPKLEAPPTQSQGWSNGSVGWGKERGRVKVEAAVGLGRNDGSLVHWLRVRKVAGHGAGERKKQTKLPRGEVDVADMDQCQSIFCETFLWIQLCYSVRTAIVLSR